MLRTNRSILIAGMITMGPLMGAMAQNIPSQSLDLSEGNLPKNSQSISLGTGIGQTSTGGKFNEFNTSYNGHFLLGSLDAESSSGLGITPGIDLSIRTNDGQQAGTFRVNKVERINFNGKLLTLYTGHKLAQEDPNISEKSDLEIGIQTMEGMKRIIQSSDTDSDSNQRDFGELIVGVFKNQEKRPIKDEILDRFFSASGLERHAFGENGDLAKKELYKALLESKNPKIKEGLDRLELVVKSCDEIPDAASTTAKDCIKKIDTKLKEAAGGLYKTFLSDVEQQIVASITGKKLQLDRLQTQIKTWGMVQVNVGKLGGFYKDYKDSHMRAAGFTGTLLNPAVQLAGEINKTILLQFCGEAELGRIEAAHYASRNAENGQIWSIGAGIKGCGRIGVGPLMLEDTIGVYKDNRGDYLFGNTAKIEGVIDSRRIPGIFKVGLAYDYKQESNGGVEQTSHTGSATLTYQHRADVK